MEEGIRESAFNSFNKFNSFIESFIPEKVVVESVFQVRNYFQDGTIVQSNMKNNTKHIPLFETDLMRAFDDSGFNYATGINNFVGAIMNIFNKMVEEINRVPEV